MALPWTPGTFRWTFRWRPSGAGSSPTYRRSAQTVRRGSRVTGTTSAAAPSEAADLLERCSELKRQLVEFARSRRFSRQLDEAVSKGIGSTVTDDGEFANLLDHFILHPPLAHPPPLAQ